MRENELERRLNWRKRERESEWKSAHKVTKYVAILYV